MNKEKYPLYDHGGFVQKKYYHGFDLYVNDTCRPLLMKPDFSGPTLLQEILWKCDTEGFNYEEKKELEDFILKLIIE